jgi:Ca2+-binding RTX toxin-like protein
MAHDQVTGQALVAVGVNAGGNAENLILADIEAATTDLSNLTQTDLSGVLINATSANYTTAQYDVDLNGAAGDTVTAALDTTVIGTSVAHTITGSDTADVIVTGGGSDVIVSGDGADEISSGAGNDTVNSGDGADYVTTGNGNDVVEAGDGDDTVLGGAGNDTIVAGDGADNVTGGTGVDDIDLSAGGDADVLVIANGDDTDSSAQSDNGTAGLTDGDTITFANGVDIVRNFVDGEDTIDLDTASAGYTAVATFDVDAANFGIATEELQAVRGDYDATTGIFTTDSVDGADMLLAYDNDAAGTVDIELLLMIGNGADTINAADIV